MRFIRSLEHITLSTLLPVEIKKQALGNHTQGIEKTIKKRVFVCQIGKNIKG